MKKALYTGLFLDEVSRVAAINAVSYSHDLLDKVIAHHLILKFKPSREEVLALPVGQLVKFTVLGFAADRRAQALSCTVPSSLVCSNEHPHVTVSVASGVSPVYSNTVLARGSLNPLTPFELTGRVGFSDGRYDYFEFVGTI